MSPRGSGAADCCAAPGAPPRAPYFKGRAAPEIIKLENIFSQVIKFDLQKKLTLFGIQVWKKMY